MTDVLLIHGGFYPAMTAFVVPFHRAFTAQCEALANAISTFITGSQTKECR